MANHFIKKQIIEIDVPSQKEADAIQERIINIYNKKVLPVLDKLFTNLSDNDQLIEIDKLEIDLGNLQLDDLERSLVEQIYVKVREKLNDAILLTKIRELRKSNENYFSDLEVNVGYAKSESLRNIIHFFKTGLFHWRDESRKEDKTTIRTRTEQWIKEKPQQLVEYLEPLLIFESVIRRIFYQTSRVFIKQLLVELKVNSNKALLINYWLKELKIELIKDKATNTIKSLENIKGEIKIHASEHELIKFLDSLNEKNWKEILEGISSSKVRFEELDSQEKKLIKNKEDLTEDRIKKLSLREQFLDAYEEYKLELEKSNEKKVEEPLSGELPKDDTEIIEGLDQKQKTEETEKLKEKAHINNSEPIDEVYLSHAGIILLWPYFSPFFNALGLLEGKEFKSEREKEKAVLILHYLTTGIKEEIEEPDLALNKILCGLEVDDPVPSRLVLTENEVKECEDLLEAVLANWEKMRTYSIEALQETFLQREGVLSTKNTEGLNIIVQRTGVDLLLDSLPWSISLIRLPWLEVNIYVEW